jgi:endonuclease VIII
MEGPSLVILAEQLAPFQGRLVMAVGGNTKAGKERLLGQKVLKVFPSGKYLNFQFAEFGFRIHFLMFGSYRIDEKREGMAPRLSLAFGRRELNFYNCSLKIIEGDLSILYDARFDIMSPNWDKKAVLKRLKEYPQEEAGDALLDQNIFAGVGNIIRNDVLWLCHIHPQTKIGNLSPSQLKMVVGEAREYSLRFYELKKDYLLKKGYYIYRKAFCPRCGHPITHQTTGKRKRKSHWCPICQPEPKY